MDDAWNLRTSAKAEHDRAYDEKQRAYETQQAAWQEYDRVRSRNNPLIDRLSAQQEAAYQNMRRAFDSASAAHSQRDGAGAAAYAAQGHRYKADAQGYVADRRRLVEENKAARARHDATKPAFKRARDNFNRAKRDYDRAKADHQQKQKEFKRAKEQFDQAVRDFQNRLATVRAESNRRRAEKQALAAKAGVPFEHRNDVHISHQPDGTVNIYFGGLGEPNGLGHGHYVINRSGKVTYRRDPFQPHGSQNFTEPLYWHKIKMSYDKDSGNYQTDNYIGIIGEKGQKSKAHIAINEDGEIVFVRDVGGEILYSRKERKGRLPDDLDWSK